MVSLSKRRRAQLNLLGKKDGQGLVEYALILLLIAVFVVLAVQNFGSTTNNMYSTINSNLSNP